MPILCGSQNDTPAEQKIAACTAFIESLEANATGLATAYNNRGNAFAAKGQYDLAIKDYDESIKHNPKTALAFNNRGVAYGKKGDYARAISDFTAAINIGKDDVDAIVNRGLAYGKYARLRQGAQGFGRGHPPPAQDRRLVE